MNGLLQLLRESLPKIIGGLAVAAALAFVGALYARWGKVGAAIAVVTILLLLVWLYARTRKEHVPPTPPPPPLVEPSLPVPRPPHRVVIRFIDRHDEQGRDIVELVIQLLEEGHCINLWGSGGVGKTTLAVEATYRVFPTPFSSGIIWDTADGRADYGLATLLDKVLTALGREDARTLALDAKADLVSYLLNQSTPCLLALDNFETIAKEEQKKILGFLTGVSCPALLTSRMRLPQAQNIRVGPMTAEEAKQFLQSLVDQSTERAKLKRVDLEQIADVAERNPWLMRSVVAQLEQAMRPEDVFEDIARGRGKTIDRIFGRTFRLLGDDGQTALLALALFVPTASRGALVAVCALEDGKDRVNEAIRRLAAFDLLDTALEGDRLGIVALTRRLTEAQLKRDERTEALKERFVSYFLAYAEAHPEVTKEDLDALDEERENLLAALDYAYATDDWGSVIRLAKEICPPAAGLLGVRGYWDEATKWGERAAEAATQANLPAIAAGFSGNVGMIHFNRGDYAEAREAYQNALLFFQEAGHERNVAVAFHQLGMLAQAQGDYQQAKNLYKQSLEIKSNLGDQAGIAPSLYQLGMLAQAQGNYDEAKDLYNQSLEIARNLGEQAGIANILGQLGTLAQDQGDYQKAETLYNQSLEIARNLGDQAAIAASLHQLGRLAEIAGDKEEASRLYQEALEIFERIGSAHAAMAGESLASVSKEKE